MRLSYNLMTNKDVQTDKLGTFAKRSDRSLWAESQENLVRDLCPYPITYDVNQTQDTGFSEFTYTELLSGLWVCTQSLEINCRLLTEASMCSSKSEINIDELISDKYNLNSDIGDWHKAKKICFMPGHNAFDIASVELLSRLVHENDDLYFKPHPVTNEEAIGFLGTRFGWNKIIPKDISGNSLLVNCEEVYTTSASEMALAGTLLGKRVYNISNFFNEGSGCYHSINRLLFSAHKQGIDTAKKLAINLINCEWSGIIMPGHSDVTRKLEAYYEKSLAYRSMFKPLASPRGNPPNKPRTNNV